MRYKVQTPQDFFYIHAVDDEEAAFKADDQCRSMNTKLLDVIQDEPSAETEHLDGESLLWL